METKPMDLIVERLLKYADSAEAFASKEIPAYVKEFMEYEAWYHQQWIYWGFVPFVVFLILALCSPALCKDDESPSLAAFGCACLFLAVAFLTVPHSYLKLKKIEKAPRVYLIETLRR